MSGPPLLSNPWILKSLLTSSDNGKGLIAGRLNKEISGKQVIVNVNGRR